MRLRILLLFFSACAGRADIRGCVCDLAGPDIAQIRACSLCLEAEKRPADEAVFFVKDNDPTKPNRWLALPRAKYDGADPLAQMSPAARELLWNAAIAKAKEIWGDSWAIAMNGDIARRQCHAHVHIGKLLLETERAEKETDPAAWADGPAQLPAVSDGTGLWFHPVGSRLHVHTGGENTERVLMR